MLYFPPSLFYNKSASVGILISLLIVSSSISALGSNITPASAATFASSKVFASNLNVQSQSTYIVTIVAASTSNINSIVVSFPSGYTVTGATFAGASNIPETGTFAVNIATQTITYSFPALKIQAGTEIILVVSGIVNPSNTGSYSINIATKNNGNTIDSGTASSNIALPPIADNTVSTSKIQNGAINSSKLATNAVQTANIANNATTNGKIADGAISFGKLAASVQGMFASLNNAIVGLQISFAALSTQVNNLALQVTGQQDRINTIGNQTVSLQGKLTNETNARVSADNSLQNQINTIQLTPGPQGPAGVNGSQIFVSAGAPASNLGLNKDLYIDSDNSQYYQKSNSGWSLKGTLQGSQGPQGQAGSKILVGSTAPANTDGNSGDLYIDSSSGNYYHKDIAWNLIGSLVGPQGQSGEAGSKIFAISGQPNSSFGNDGDLYINTDNSTYFSKQSGQWVFKGSLQGQPGSNGSAGQNNTGANVGTGESAIYNGMSGTTLQFKTFHGGSGISIDNGTTNQIITVNSTVTGINLAPDNGNLVSGLVSSNDVNGNLRFYSLQAGTGIILTKDPTNGVIRIDAANSNSNGQCSTISNWPFPPNAPGAFYGYADENNCTPIFSSFVGSGGITVTNTTGIIRIDGSNVVSNAVGSNLTGGSGFVYKNKTGNNLFFRTLQGDNGIIVTTQANTVTISGNQQDTDAIDKPRVQAIFPSLYGATGASSVSTGLWGGVVANPGNTVMHVSAVVVTAFLPSGAGTIFTSTGAGVCSLAPTYITPLASDGTWNCPAPNVLMWTANPGLYPQGYPIAASSAKEFLVGIGRPATNLDLPSFAINFDVFTDYDELSKAGYSSSMSKTVSEIGNVYLSAHSSCANPCTTTNAGMIGTLSIRSGTILNVNASIGNFGDTGTSTINSGTRLIITVPKAFTIGQIVPTAGFNVCSITGGPTQPKQISCTLSTSLIPGTSRTIQFQLVAPTVTSSTLYSANILALGTDANNWPVRPLAQNIITVTP